MIIGSFLFPLGFNILRLVLIEKTISYSYLVDMP